MLKLLKQLQDSENGSVFILVAVSSLLLIAATGAAVDMARAQTLQQKISASLDAAGLAAGATANTTDPVGQATRYFNANFPSGYLGAGTITLNTTCADMNGNSVACTSPSTYTINLSASTNQTTTFMKAVGVNSIAVSAKSQITRQTSGLELALVLDNTGSMGVSLVNGQATKINALKCSLAGDAAFGSGSTYCETNSLVTTGLLDILYGGNTTLPDLFVGVIPLSDMVRTGVTAAPGSGFVNNLPLTSGTPNGCVDSRNPTTASTADSGITLPSGDTITLDISDDPPSTAYFQALKGSTNTTCTTASVQPMSLNKSDAVTAIKAMTPGGSTLLNIGLAWGWRMLSPNWNGLWGASPTFTYPGTTTTVPLPLPYNTTHMLKVLVFMTDGMNNNGASSDSTNLTSSTNPTNSDNAYDKQSYEPSNTKLDQLTKDTCDAIKAKGIVIYTIAFGNAATHSPPTNSDRNNSTLVDAPLLQYCATQNYTGDTSHFFLAINNGVLANAFQQIGNQLANLRVSQ